VRNGGLAGLEIPPRKTEFPPRLRRTPWKDVIIDDPGVWWLRREGDRNVGVGTPARGARGNRGKECGMASLFEVECGLEIAEGCLDQLCQAPQEDRPDEVHRTPERKPESTPKPKTESTPEPERSPSKLPWCETHRVYNCGCRARKYYKGD